MGHDSLHTQSSWEAIHTEATPEGEVSDDQRRSKFSKVTAIGWLRLVGSFRLQVSFAKDP